MIVTKNKHIPAKTTNSISIVLAGNPNVGKSTIFNRLTGQNQHTGNWAGKTVDIAKGHYAYKDSQINITDLPGAYSMSPNSPEEQVSSEYIVNSPYDVLVIVVSATSLERNLLFALQILMHTHKAILCLNMIDETEKNNIFIDTDELSLQLGIPVIPISAKKQKHILELNEMILDVADEKVATYKLNKLEVIKGAGYSYYEQTEELSSLAKSIVKYSVKANKSSYSSVDRALDKIFTSKLYGIPIMVLVFAIVFWLTAYGANYPSQLLSWAFDKLNLFFNILMQRINCPLNITSILSDGILTTTAWVVSVMLPPALIFFPLFALLEESGYLPRVAFNLDRFFKKAGINGKVSLTMLMGFGCNACGVMGCRIIHSKKERFIATVTNSFIPCNGRIPTLISLSGIFFTSFATGMKASILTTCIFMSLLILSVTLTLIVSKIITIFYKDDASSGFIMELPTYKKPQIIKVIIRTIKEKVLFVLSRAVLISIPAGAVIWLSVNLKINNIELITHFSNFINPAAVLLGLDGIILTAFILGFPANEIVIPVILMTYLNTSSLTDYSSTTQLGEILKANGWTTTTAICCCVFCLFHFPCSTTCCTIKRETSGISTTVFSVLIPLLTGTVICMLINYVARLFC